MNRLAWATDIHLNFLQPAQLDPFVDDLAKADAILLGGDIAEAPTLEPYLSLLERRLDRPIYFVLGNHDFYYGSIPRVRKQMEALSGRSKHLRWLPVTGVVELTKETALLGHDGWGDARIGDFEGSKVSLNDFVLIEELSGLSSPQLRAKLHALGDEAAAWVRVWLPRALERHSRAIFLTHVPPFRESCWHEGRISDDDWLPFFTCKAMGDALIEAMRGRPDRDLTVLCGHTHGSGTVEILPNLHVFTGGAKYGHPQVQKILTVS